MSFYEVVYNRLSFFLSGVPLNSDIIKKKHSLPKRVVRATKEDASSLDNSIVKRIKDQKGTKLNPIFLTECELLLKPSPLIRICRDGKGHEKQPSTVKDSLWDITRLRFYRGSLGQGTISTGTP